MTEEGLKAYYGSRNQNPPQQMEEPKHTLRYIFHDKGAKLNMPKIRELEKPNTYKEKYAMMKV